MQNQGQAQGSGREVWEGKRVATSGSPTDESKFFVILHFLINKWEFYPCNSMVDVFISHLKCLKSLFALNYLSKLMAKHKPSGRSPRFPHLGLEWSWARAEKWGKGHILLRGVEGSLANRKPRRRWPTIQSADDGGLPLGMKQKRIWKEPLEKAGRSGQRSARHWVISLLGPASLSLCLNQPGSSLTPVSGPWNTNAFHQQRAVSPHMKMGFKKILNYLHMEGTKKKKSE